MSTNPVRLSVELSVGEACLSEVAFAQFIQAEPQRVLTRILDVNFLHRLRNPDQPSIFYLTENPTP